MTINFFLHLAWLKHAYQFYIVAYIYKECEESSSLVSVTICQL